jgi:hypothetical protein
MGGHPVDLAVGPGLLDLTGLLLVGAIGHPIQPYYRDQIAAFVNPQSAGQPEAVPWVLFDTQLYTSATTTQLTFFRTQQADATMSNMLQGGALTDPQHFQIYHLGFDVLADNTTEANGPTGILDDIALLMLVNRGTFTLDIQQKLYGPFPLSLLHTSGGPVGVIAGGVANEFIQSGNNSFPDGGWNWFGGVWIPPKVSFGVILNWSAATTFSDAANKNLRFWMSGTLYRSVV